MATLWELWTRKKPVAEESKIFNPLSLRVGNALRIETVDLESHIFHISRLREITRNINGEKFRAVDYDVSARPLDSDPIQCRIRLVENGNEPEFLLLRKLGECAYEEEFHKGLAFEVNEGVWKEGEGDDQAVYWRVNDVKTEYHANTVLLDDRDGSGRVDENEVTHGKLAYWDYWRNTELEGNEVLEFYFVEMDGETGFFEFWVGTQFNANRVSVL